MVDFLLNLLHFLLVFVDLNFGPGSIFIWLHFISTFSTTFSITWFPRTAAAEEGLD